MEEFKDSKSAVVADVDCTVHQDLCGKHGVQGYPTIKYGDPNNMEDYQGGRTYEDLSAFAKENLGPSCGPANLDLCDAEQKKAVEDAMALSAEDLAAKIAEGEKKMEDAESTFKSELESSRSDMRSSRRRRRRPSPTSRRADSACSSLSRPARSKCCLSTEAAIVTY